MKKDLMKIVAFILYVVAIGFFIVFLSSTDSYGKIITEWIDGEGYNDIGYTYWYDNLTAHANATKLVLGDSVSAQIFNPLQEQNEEYAFAGTTAAATSVGQYIMLQHFYEVQPDVTDVYIMLRPQSFQNEWDTNQTYLSFLLPLYQAGGMSQMPEKYMEKLNDVFGEKYLQDDMMQKMSDSILCRKLYVNSLQKVQSYNGYTAGVSEVFAEGMGDIKKFCEEREIQLHIIAMPLAKSLESYPYEDYVELAKGYGLSAEWDSMMNSQTYYLDEVYRDGMHFWDDWLNENRHQVIDTILEKSGETMESLNY